MEQNPPLETLRDGRLKATIWENRNEAGEPYHTVTLAKTFEDRDGKLQDTSSFTAGELLRVSELAREAFTVLRAMRRTMALERKTEPAARRAAQDADTRPKRFRGYPPFER